MFFPSWDVGRYPKAYSLDCGVDLIVVLLVHGWAQKSVQKMMGSGTGGSLNLRVLDIGWVLLSHPPHWGRLFLKLAHNGLTFHFCFRLADVISERLTLLKQFTWQIWSSCRLSFATCSELAKKHRLLPPALSVEVPGSISPEIAPANPRFTVPIVRHALEVISSVFSDISWVWYFSVYNENAYFKTKLNFLLWYYTQWIFM